MANLMTLDTLKAQSEELSALITCTESDVASLRTDCLSELKRQLESRQESREAVTGAVGMLWTAAHMTFFQAHAIQEQQMERVYELSAMWIHQRLLTIQTSREEPVAFAQYVTVGSAPRTAPSRLYAKLTEVIEVTLLKMPMGWDAAVLASSEVLADVVTQLYGIEHWPYGLDLWPLVATMIRYEDLMALSGPSGWGT